MKVSPPGDVSSPRHGTLAALTLVEVLVIIAVIAILIGLLMPTINHGGKSPRFQCMSDLKQIGISYRLWAEDNGDKYPQMSVVTNGDSIEPAFLPVAAEILEVLSNELNDPKILVCPADTSRAPATNFSDLSNQHVSYFVGLDADETTPQILLSGDRNLTNGTRLKNGILTLSTNHPAGWTETIHHNVGNVGLADGSVQIVTGFALRRQISSAGITTNRLAMP